MKRWWVAAVLLGAFAARAETTLDVPGLLSRPGVKAVAVEFYATWCKPCMEAMPRWKELQKRYGRDGLKVVVVNTRDANGSCATLGWKPDQVVCDLDGVISEQLGVQQLPAAFLWSWQGNLLVQGGHVGEVEATVEAAFKAAPRVELRTDGSVPTAVMSALKARLTDTSKLVVVANEKERDTLATMRLAQQRATVDPDVRCELGRELPPNTLLKASKVNGGRDDYLSLELFDVEKGCQSAATNVAWDAESPDRAVRDAVENLLAKLRRPTPEWPNAQESRSAEPASPNRTGTLALSVDVDGALLTIDGTPKPDALAAKRASLEVKSGEHRVRISKQGYLDDLRTVTVAPGGRTTVDAKLVPEKPVERKPKTTDRTTLLQVETLPTGAVIVIDDEPVGRAPGLFELSPGRHVVKARLNWYREAVTAVDLDAGVPFAKSIELVADFGKLEVTAAQSGVVVSLDDAGIGVADPTLKRSPVTPGCYRLRATLPDHHDYETTVRIRANETALVKIPALRSAVGALTVTTEPPGAVVEVDGRTRGTTPVTVEKLVGGTHELRLTRKGCTPTEQPVEVFEGETRPVSVRLDSRLSRLQVSSAPLGGATVFVDGESVGRTPLTVEVEEGDHQVRVEGEARSYRPWAGRVTAIRDRDVAVAAELSPLVGELLVVSVPFGASVLLDAAPAGVTPLKRTDLLGGTHRIEVRKEGFRPETRHIDIEDDRTTRVEVTLVELVGEELAADRLASWRARAAPLRSRAWTRTWLAFGTSALAVGAGLQWRSLLGTRDAALAAYESATSDAAVRFDTYASAWRQTLAWGTGAGVAAVASASLGWSAFAAWSDVPAKPVFEVLAGRVGVGVQGEW